MIKKIHMFLVLLGVLSVVTGAPVEVSNLRVNQRQPWNGKVNIDFVLGGDIEGAEYKVWLYCYDEIGKKSVPINTVRYDGQGEIATEFFLRAGAHRLVWDADVDVPGQVYQNVTINVDAELHSHSDAYTSQYVIIDLSGGAEASSYPISILNNVPEGGWTDEYKTTKLVLRKCPKGRDPTDASAYEISKEFYAGVFEVTQKQWELVMGTNPSHFSGDTKPVESVSYDMIRGVNKGAQWPANSEVDEDSFFGRLRAKTGFVELDLPTKAQGEYACRAGTKTTYYTGNAESDLTRAGWYRGNNANAGGSHILPSLGGIYRDTHKVGELEPNSWGLYDMHGNVCEWCLDWFSLNYTWAGNDPVGPETGDYRVFRGGSWWNLADGCSLDSFVSNDSYTANETIGFRVFRTIPSIKAQSSVRNNTLDTMPNQKTTTTLIPIPYEWLDDYVVKYGGENNDYEVAANAIGENGVSLWESCVAGLNPDVETSKFFAKIVVGNDGSTNVTWEPDLSNDPVRRIYKVQGCRVLGEEWVEVNAENINQYRFFKVMLVGIEE